MSISPFAPRHWKNEGLRAASVSSKSSCGTEAVLLLNVKGVLSYISMVVLCFRTVVLTWRTDGIWEAQRLIPFSFGRSDKGNWISSSRFCNPVLPVSTQDSWALISILVFMARRRGELAHSSVRQTRGGRQGKTIRAQLLLRNCFLMGIVNITRIR